MSHKRKLSKDAELGQELSELWDDNAEVMGEMAAYHVACEQLGIDPDEGYDLMALLNEELEKSK